MRIRLKKPRQFFDKIIIDNNLSLKQIADMLGIQYSLIKKYRRGSLTISEEIVKSMEDIFRTRAEISEILKETWGQTNGGKKKVNNLDNKKLKEHMKYIRSFKQIKKIKLIINKFLCEFYGILMGDGCISKFKDFYGVDRILIVISGNKKLDSSYLKDLKENLKKEYGFYSYYYEYKNRNVCTLSIKNKGLALSLTKLGFPIGKKYKKLKIPYLFLKHEWNYKKFILKGLFDTDGSIYSRKDEGYKYPIISIKSKSYILLNQILKLLRNNNYPAYISGNNVAIRGNKNINKWFKDIGSSNPRNMLKYRYWLENKILPPKIIEKIIGPVVHR